MKIGLIGLFCCILCLPSSFAQGKVLIITRDTNGFKYSYPQRFESSLPLLQAALQKHYQGNVVTHLGLLPDSLEEFDAVFTDLRFFEEDDSMLVASETKKISTYMQTKGNLYIEVSDFSTRQFPTDSTFYMLVGLPKFSYASQVLKGVEEVVGIEGQFTDGLPRHLRCLYRIVSFH